MGFNGVLVVNHPSFVIKSHSTHNATVYRLYLVLHTHALELTWLDLQFCAFWNFVCKSESSTICQFVKSSLVGIQPFYRKMRRALLLYLFAVESNESDQTPELFDFP